MSELFKSDYMGGWEPTSESLKSLILNAVNSDRGRVIQAPDDAFYVTYHPDGLGRSQKTSKVIASHVSGKGTNGLGVVQFEDPLVDLGWFAILKMPSSSQIAIIHNPDQAGMSNQRDRVVWSTSGSPEYGTEIPELVRSTLEVFSELGIPVIETRESLLPFHFQATLEKIFPPKEKRRRK
jgi:hypothetical protein